MKYLIVLLGFTLCIGFDANAQLPVEKYYNVDDAYVVIDSTIYDFRNSPIDSVLKYKTLAEDYLKTCDLVKDKYKVAGIYHYIIHTNLALERQDTALMYLYKALDLPGTNSSKGAIDIHWGINRIFRFSENYSGQLQQLDILSKLGSKHDYYKETEPGNLRKRKVDVFLNAGFYEEARMHYKDNLILDSLAVDPVKYAVINNDLAFIYENLGQPDSVVKYRKKALQALESDIPNPYNPSYKAYIKDYIILHGYKYNRLYTQNTLNFAKDFLKNARQNFEGEIHTSIFACHFIAEHFFSTENYEEALIYVDKALSLGKGKLHLQKQQELYILKSRILDMLGDKEMADKTIAELKSKQSEKLANNRILDLMQYEVEDIKIEKTKAEQQALQNESKYNQALIILVGCLVIIVITSFAFSITRQKNKSIKTAQNEVSQKLKEKEFLLRELNHRVKNNLSLILSLVKFQANQITTKEFKQKFEHLEQRIKAIIVAHEQFLYKSGNLEGECFDLKQYLVKIANGLISISPRKVELDLKIKTAKVNMDTALPIGILVNELITNSLEHALDKDTLVVSLSITQNLNTLNITYKDSGSGFKTPVNQDSLGLSIIESMVEQLLGTLKREQSSYSITLKLKNVKAS